GGRRARVRGARHAAAARAGAALRERPLRHPRGERGHARGTAGVPRQAPRELQATLTGSPSDLDVVRDDLIPMIVSLLLGTLVGLERQMGRKPAALRTHL